MNYENSVSKISIINKRVSFDELKNIHLDADYIIFPYTDISQSGPLRYSCELGSSILVPKMDGSIDQLFNYEDKFLFDINDLQNLIRKLRNKNIGILITDHNVRATLAITERSYILNQGEILANGSSDQLTKNEDWCAKSKKQKLSTKMENTKEKKILHC